MMQSASLISTLAVTVVLLFLPAINRTTYNAYGFSFDHPAPHSPSMSSDRVVVPSTNRVVDIHRPVPQQLQDQQQQQQRPMMIADSVLLQNLLDYTEQQNDDVLNSPPRPRTTLMKMTESTPHQMGEDLKTTDLANWYSWCLSEDDRFDMADCKVILIEQLKLMISRENNGIGYEETTDLANWYSSCLSEDDRFGAADCKMILVEQQKLIIARENNGLRIAFLGMIAVFVNINTKQDTLPAANKGEKSLQKWYGILVDGIFPPDKQP
ncbi:hypothetical protein FRACYDRAFT_236272 [Fragilariopsis cylindrus CCMP1102]|uniref:Uncharacterized protein n=1 Tax=Fragilariopsis cylindrus CCMP1102 TaxID=635003 RepID=A0A1E7FPW2_9STRA|nr:hypothetical protein FRACYDRAFT_236272 [Fragilariopsis cylindrus CCMP1102]|eukprot:OEU20202.1 hypothetical protein FRACYDRAFT_236272 [Fragilariopsis cylindrus CCMP1102]